jgi:hypothetical protein
MRRSRGLGDVYKRQSLMVRLQILVPQFPKINQDKFAEARIKRMELFVGQIRFMSQALELMHLLMVSSLLHGTISSRANINLGSIL